MSWHEQVFLSFYLKLSQTLVQNVIVTAGKARIQKVLPFIGKYRLYNTVFWELGQWLTLFVRLHKQ